MNFNDLYPSSYLKASDLQGRAVRVTIESLSIEDLDTERKPALHFQGKQKALILNKTNGSILASQFSPETDGWVGKPIELYPDKVAFQGQIVDCIRVRVPVPPAQPAAPQPATVYGDQHAGQPQPAPAGVPAINTDEDIPW